MIDLTVMQQPSKPDRIEPARPTDADQSKGKDQTARFDDEYNKQADQKVKPKESEDTPVQEDQPVVAETSSEGDDEATVARDEKKLSAETKTSNPEVVPVEGQSETPKPTRALSENAFGEQVANAQKAHLKPSLQQEDQPTRNVPATSLEDRFRDNVPTQTTTASRADVKVQSGTRSPEATSVPKPSQSAPEPRGSKLTSEPLTRVEQAKPELANTSSVVQAASLSAGGAHTGKTMPHISMTADESTARSDARRARIVAQRNDPLPFDTAKGVTPNPLMTAKPAQATPQPSVQVAATEGFDLSFVSAEPDAPMSFDAKTSAPPALHQVLNRPETPTMVSRQLTEALQRFPDRPVEVALNPEELGRVRMTISALETGITVTVLAERPETLDMMRRHIDQLARDFQAIGYDSINFAFAEGQSDQNHDPDQQGSHSTGPSAERDAPDDAVTPIHLTATSGLDVRL